MIIPLKSTVEQLTSTMQSLHGKMQTSVKRGNLGEGLVAENVMQTFPLAEIIDTSHLKHKGDFHVIFNDLEVNILDIFIEVKFHQVTLDNATVQKFKNEVIQHETCHAGILVSTSSSIAFKHHFQYELTQENKLIVYLPQAGTNGGISLIWAIYFIRAFIKMMKSNSNATNNTNSIKDSENISYYKRKLDQCFELTRIHMN
jgi:hypothetical protein